MLDEGLFRRFSFVMRSMRYIISPGMFQWVNVSFRPGPFMCSSDIVSIQIKGPKEAMGGLPQLAM